MTYDIYLFIKIVFTINNNLEKILHCSKNTEPFTRPSKQMNFEGPSLFQ